jgi:hypothetical protein
VGTIIFDFEQQTPGQSPFELVLHGPPRAQAEGNSVLATLPVFVPEAPGGTVDIRVLLPIRHAEHLMAQMQPALSIARRGIGRD